MKNNNGRSERPQEITYPEGRCTLLDFLIITRKRTSYIDTKTDEGDYELAMMYTGWCVTGKWTTPPPGLNM